MYFSTFAKASSLAVLAGACSAAVTVYSATNFGGATDYCGGPEYDFVYPFRHTLDGVQHSIKSDSYVYEVYTKEMSLVACVDTQGWGNISAWPTVYYCVKTRRTGC